ncbi:hypothetical protein, partial [Streptomyces sp. NPDC088794]|uniref:hypothetical protein n=1 Tax=Streptomyces sp. NPDC088794 TaxID=3365902 RepID=UPI0037F3CACA
ARRGRPAQRARGRSSAPPQPLRTGERFLDLSAAAVREQDAKTPGSISQTDAVRIPHHTNA